MVRKTLPLNLIVICILLLQLVVCPVNTLGNVKQGITIEQAIQLVKDNFEVPESYSQLSTEYKEYSDRTTYLLNWNSDQAPYGSFQAEVDATSGEILSIDQWNESQTSSFKLPVLSSEDASKIASDLMTKLAGRHLPDMQLIKEKQQVYVFNDSQPFTYNYRWLRVVNGIPFPENGVAMRVSGEDGRIISYNYNWTKNLVFPSASKIITQETARQVFTSTPMLELQYFLPPILNPQAEEEQQVLLVYQLTNNYYGGAVDALTGKPLTLDKPILASNSLSIPAKSGGSLSAAPVPESRLKISALEGNIPISESPADQDSSNPSDYQITQKEAVEIVKKAVTIPKDFILRNSNLNPDWQNPNEQVWDLNWNTDSYESGDQRFLNARVNAQTGDLVSFNLSYGLSTKNKSKPVNRRDAQRIAEDFLKRIQPEHFELVKPEAENSYEGKMPPNTQLFSYVRLVDGIPVSQNGILLAVDTVAKQVTNYEMNWSNQEFPIATDVLSLERAAEQFLQIRPLTLKYTLIFDPSGQLQVRLVYQANSNYELDLPVLLDAKTGNFMDWLGNPQAQWFKANTYTDIEGNYAEKEISILGLTGAFGEYGDKFCPGEKITTGALIRAMLTAEAGNWDRVISDEDVLKVAKERGWLPEDGKLEQELSRADLCKIMIRLLHMETSAQVKGVYAVPFADASVINPDSMGYIALAWGLGIIKIDQNTFSPNQGATRAEAAYALVHAYTVGRQMKSYLR
ncbi:YcdB/YcdC domain-containing protein [Desulfosporosinus hippei]|uniref:S-layer homology domain-containing protein n=1 Tax=Desulfosporosinus hippei DSM 8344 TaxID=1121419 RepID=A0A1G8HE32_9FIRM|nr:YcdB/YcdC domain-containing protein [Desulfosporosinus hippei]SDI04938.1 S-layer homology domain-containing protein [Desulfosporosinus hippei DSM 8344]